ncbi:hypothetical protein MRX96_047176 [Rhipicephalus microplus]
MCVCFECGGINGRSTSTWHLGFHKTEYTPTNRGFLSHVGSWGGACEYTTHQRAAIGSNDYGLDFRRNSTLAPEDSGRYYTEIITEEAVSLIKNHPVDKPMFLYVAHLAPHYGTVRLPLEAPAEYHEGYDFIGPKNRTIYATPTMVPPQHFGAPTARHHILCGEKNPPSGRVAYEFPGSYGLRSHCGTEEDLNMTAFFTLQTGYQPYTRWQEEIRPSLVEFDGVSHLRSITDPLTDLPRSEVLLNIDPIEGNEAIIQDSYKLVYGSVSRCCIESITYKILNKRGFSPNCGEGGGVYSTSMNCGKQNSKQGLV